MNIYDSFIDTKIIFKNRLTNTEIIQNDMKLVEPPKQNGGLLGSFLTGALNILDSILEEASAQNTALAEIKTLCQILLNDNSDKNFSKKSFRNEYFTENNIEIYMSYDDTIFGSCNDGFAITQNGIYSHEMFSAEVVYVSFDDFKNTKTITTNGSLIFADNLQIAYKGGSNEKKERVIEIFQAIRYILNK